MLEKVDLFAKLPAEQLEILEKFSTRRKYPKNNVLFMEGDPMTHLFIIESGKVSVYVNGEDGKQVILNFMGPGNYFGELALIDSKPRVASISTVTECTLITISPEKFQQFLYETPEFAMHLLQQLVGRIRELTDSVKDLALLDVYGRVARLLTRLSDDEGKISNPKLTHQDIANMVGASREMVSRIMKELVIGGYVEQKPDMIVLQKKLPTGF